LIGRFNPRFGNNILFMEEAYCRKDRSGVAGTDRRIRAVRDDTDQA